MEAAILLLVVEDEEATRDVLEDASAKADLSSSSKKTARMPWPFWSRVRTAFAVSSPISISAPDSTAGNSPDGAGNLFPLCRSFT